MTDDGVRGDQQLGSFWSVVRRRHPDLDLVLLPVDVTADAPDPGPEGVATTASPGEPPPAETPELPPAGSPPPGEPAEAAARCVAQAETQWGLLVPDRAPPEPETRWVPGPVRGSVRHETTLAVEGVEPVPGTRVITRAAEELRSREWHVLAPQEGMPRVLAGRDEPPGRREVQLVLVPALGRLVLRVRSGGVVVGADTAHRLVTGGAA